MAAAALGMPAQSHLVDRPTSRLSKRITRWPRAAGAAQKSSSQRIICAARPMMRRSGRPSGAPKISYAISMPLARAAGMRPSLAELAGAGQALAATEPERLEGTRSEGRRRPLSSRMERVGGAGIEPATLGLSGHREKTASPRSSAGSSAGRGLDEARYVDRVRRRATEVDGLPGTPQDESHRG